MESEWTDDWQNRPSARLPDKTHTNVIYLVHSHWFSFAPLPPIWFYGAAFFAISLIIFAFLNIALVLHKLATATIPRHVASFLFLSCMNQLALLGFKLVPHVHFALSGAWDRSGWSWGPFFCQLSAASGVLFLCADVAISASWVWFTFRVPNPSCIVLLISVVATYAISALLAFAPTFQFGSYVLEGMITTCSFDYLTPDITHQSYIALWIIWQFTVPVLIAIIAWSYPSAQTEDAADAEKNSKVSNAALGTFVLRFTTSLPYITIVLLSQIDSLNISPALVTYASLVANGLTFFYFPLHYTIFQNSN